MNCPICSDAALVVSERQGIEIDYCPTCRGVWLDRGELDKIINRTQAATSSIKIPSITSQKDEDYEVIYEGPKEHQVDSKYYKTRKKPKRILNEIFDFLD